MGMSKPPFDLWHQRRASPGLLMSVAEERSKPKNSRCGCCVVVLLLWLLLFTVKPPIILNLTRPGGNFFPWSVCHFGGKGGTAVILVLSHFPSPNLSKCARWRVLLLPVIRVRKMRAAAAGKNRPATYGVAVSRKSCCCRGN